MKRRIILSIEINEKRILNPSSDDTIDEIIDMIEPIEGIEVKELFEGIKK